MSDSVQPHRRQPTRHPCPWDSPGKNTGVGCHFLLQCMKVKSESKVAQSCPTQRPHGLKPTRLLCPWDFPGKSTGVGCHCLLFLEHYISCCPSCQPPEYLVLPESLWPNHLHYFHTWPSQGKPRPSRAASGANPSGWPTYRSGNKTTIETQGQCG